MGEKIKDLSTFHVKGQEVHIELNDGYSNGYDIHIQSDRVQYYLSDKDFMILASTCKRAIRKFNSLKSSEELKHE